ncbi:acyltransferase family protein [Chitinophaga sp. HK235]|uniref:acyltransferase family protein n=1 Tax=Chitinophaga sp. HK235 TaxID=2952571 RepID=UPI001BA9501D|nr:acyltransferase family protein [Chitinophaga sp. HK235]
MHTHTCRLAYLDWLRVLAILGVFLFTAARPFTPGIPGPLPDRIDYMLNSSCIPLLFFISGAVSLHMALKRNKTKMVLLWIRRLLIPLITGMLLLLPPLIYLEQTQTGNQKSFWQFYPTAVRMALRPENWHHLWVIFCLAIYMVLMIPLLNWTRTVAARKAQQRLLVLAAGRRVYALLLPIAGLFAASIVLQLPGYATSFLYWWMLLLTGFCCMLQPQLMDSLERNRRCSLLLLLIAIITIIILRHFDPQGWLQIMLEPLHAGLWVFVLTGYGKKYLDLEHPLRPYANLFAYPFYMLQQPLIMLISGYVMQWEYPMVMEYIFVVLSTYLIAIVVFNLLIKPFVLTRFFFGIKPGTPPVVTGKVVKVPMPPSEFFY